MLNRSAAIFMLVALLAPAICLAQPTMDDASLHVDTLVGGLDGPTGIVFLPNGRDALAIEKDTGRVRRISGNTLVSKSALDLSVANDSEQGLLGIALHPNFSANKQVYLYYTAAAGDGGQATAHRIDRYRYSKGRLIFDRRIKTLPADPGPNHDGGRIEFGPDGKLYAVIGDLNRNGVTQNFAGAGDFSRTGAVLRLNADGSSPTDNPFYKAPRAGRDRPQNDIFAYGVRNSFGLAFDPSNGYLWDTENGSNEYDEINQIFPGFNSGWQDVMGPAGPGGSTNALARISKRAKYADPKFSWLDPVAPTDLVFASDFLGGAYDGDLLVGDLDGRIYQFNLGPKRKRLILSGGLADGVADSDAERDSAVVGDGFGIITDLVMRPDGLYVVSLTHGTLYRIQPDTAGFSAAVPEPSALCLFGIAALTLLRRRR